jgi:long-chain acyl-CoA synthetase
MKGSPGSRGSSAQDKHMVVEQRSRNLAEMFRDRSERYGAAIRWRQKRRGEWHSATWLENQQLVNSLISGLDALGALPGERIGILSSTRWEWMAADWAILGLGAVTVTLYPSNVPETIAAMLENSGARFLFVENREQYEKLLSVKSRIPEVRNLIVFDEWEGAEPDSWRLSFVDLGRLSRRNPAEADAFAASRARDIASEDLASIVYTSGTTGEPKGVMLTHANLLAQVAGVQAALPTLRPGMVDLMFLPLAHVLGREEHLVGTDRGLETVVAESLDHLAADMREVRPQALISVPRVYEKAYAAILGNIASSSAIERGIFHLAQSVGRIAIRYRQDHRPLPIYLRWADALADRLVFLKIRQALGGRLEMAVTGGAPLDQEILTFFHTAGVMLLEGWGLTETGGAVTVNHVDRYRLGTVGLLYPGHEIRVARDGEILLRGPCVFQSYYRMPAETAEAFAEEGWFSTGDLGFVDSAGFVHIVDRKKDLIATSGGKKIAPQHVEYLLKTIPEVSEAAVFGDRKPYLVALMTLDMGAVQRWATKNSISPTTGSAAKIAEDSAFARYLSDRVAEANRQLAHYETVKRFAVVKPDFTVENGLLTPTQKVRRRAIYAAYRQEIETLYRVTSDATPSRSAV